MLQKFGPATKAKRLFQKSAASGEEGDPTNLVEGTYVVSEVIRFTERLINMGLTSTSTEVPLIYSSLYFYSRVITLI